MQVRQCACNSRCDLHLTVGVSISALQSGQTDHGANCRPSFILFIDHLIAVRGKSKAAATHSTWEGSRRESPERKWNWKWTSAAKNEKQSSEPQMPMTAGSSQPQVPSTSRNSLSSATDRTPLLQTWTGTETSRCPATWSPSDALLRSETPARTP